MDNRDSFFMREHPLGSGYAMDLGFIADTTPVKYVLERIAAERKWSPEAIESDCEILERNRIVHVQDLRALSRESWAQIELLPLVKDLLRGAIDPEWNNTEKAPKPVASSSGSSSTEEGEKKKDKKEKKKDKKEDEGKKKKEEETKKKKDDEGKKKKDEESKKKDKKKDKKKEKEKDKGFKSPSPLGTPVVPAILNKPQFDTTPALSTAESMLNQDRITMQNTIRNGNIEVTPALPTINTNTSLLNSSSSTSNSSSEDDYELMSPSRRKSVTFASETAIGVAASEKSTEEKKKKKEKKNKKENMASINKIATNFTSHPYTTHPVVKFRKMKMKHCKRLPEVPKDDLFLQQIHDRLKLSTD